METLAEISKLPRKGVEYSPTHRLSIGGETGFTENLHSADITYTTDGGGSGCQMALRGDLTEYDNAPIVLQLGYGDLYTPYFVGRVKRPQYFSRLDYTSLVAFGPYRRMTDQRLQEDKSYYGYTLQNALKDLIDRARYRAGEYEIRGGGDVVIDTNDLYVWNNSLGEIASSLMDGRNFVGMDQPFGKRLFRKRPRPGVFGTPDIFYSNSEYTVDAFALSPSTEMSYSKVIVQRVDVEGNQVGLYDAAVGGNHKFSPLPGEIYPRLDFFGTATEAQQEAMDIARYLRLGDYGFTFTVPINPLLELYSTFGVRAVYRNKLYAYRCIISGDINVTYKAALLDSPGQATMDISGEALTVSDGEDI